MGRREVAEVLHPDLGLRAPRRRGGPFLIALAPLCSLGLLRDPPQPDLLVCTARHQLAFLVKVHRKNGFLVVPQHRESAHSHLRKTHTHPHTPSEHTRSPPALTVGGVQYEVRRSLPLGALSLRRGGSFAPKTKKRKDCEIL